VAPDVKLLIGFTGATEIGGVLLLAATVIVRHGSNRGQLTRAEADQGSGGKKPRR